MNMQDMTLSDKVARDNNAGDDNVWQTRLRVFCSVIINSYLLHWVH